MVSKMKLLEPRFLVNVCDRWNKNKTDNLQAAWFNGVGYESWENVWGTWNGITPRDGEAIRRVGALLRYFGGGGYLQSPVWAPHVPTVQSDCVFASAFPKGGDTLYTLVNRVARNTSGAQLAVPLADLARYRAGALRFFDVYHGVELAPTLSTTAAAAAASTASSSGGGATATLAFEIEALGYGAVLATSAPSPALLSLLAPRHARTRAS